jgi:hypothetical protein
VLKIRYCRDKKRAQQAAKKGIQSLHSNVDDSRPDFTISQSSFTSDQAHLPLPTQNCDDNTVHLELLKDTTSRTPRSPNRDVSPLTELDETPPPPSRPYYCSPFPLPELNFLNGVVGKQVHAGAETVTWPCGWETVLPTLMENGMNILTAVHFFLFPFYMLISNMLVRMRNG